MITGATSAFSSDLDKRPVAGLVIAEDEKSAEGKDGATADAAWRVCTDAVVETEPVTSSSFSDPTFAITSHHMTDYQNITEKQFTRLQHAPIHKIDIRIQKIHHIFTMLTGINSQLTN